MSEIFSLEFDLSDVDAKCTEGQAHRIRSGQRLPLAAAEAGVAEAKANHAYKDRSGKLTRSGHARPIGTNGAETVAEMRWSAPYASEVDGGTKAHLIYPKLGSNTSGPLLQGQSRSRRGQGHVLLAFAMGGRLIFARKVRHPGTRPYGFAGHAYLTAERFIQATVETDALELEEILSR